VTSLTVRVAEDLTAVGRGDWDRLTHPSVYNTYDWLMARSRFIAGHPRFILISLADDDDSLIAGVPCYLVGEASHPGYEPISLLTDRELAEPASRLAGQLREYAPDCRPAISATAPGRAGGISYQARISPRLRKAAAERAVDAVEEAALSAAAPTVCWMYILDGQDDALSETLRRREYASLVIGAECYLPITFGSLEGYLATLRSGYRNKVRREMNTLTAANVQVTEHGTEILGPEIARLEQQWRSKYGRTSPIDTILTEYDGMRQHLGSKLRVFTARRGGRILGFTTFLTDGDLWYAGAGGFDYSATGLFLYYNLLFYYPIQAAISSGVRCVRYTQKSYEAKRARGCLLRNVLAFVRLPGEFSASMRPYFDAVDRTQRERFQRVAAMRVSR
jgi:predicted N-acyltransferase